MSGGAPGHWNIFFLVFFFRPFNSSDEGEHTAPLDWLIYAFSLHFFFSGAVSFVAFGAVSHYFSEPVVPLEVEEFFFFKFNFF